VFCGRVAAGERYSVEAEGCARGRGMDGIRDRANRMPKMAAARPVASTAQMSASQFHHTEA
jgi:hypothetical protein